MEIRSRPARAVRYAGNPNLNETSVRRQLDYIFAVLDKERITPSTELFNGRNNLIVDRAGTITFFDFGAYVSGNRTESGVEISVSARRSPFGQRRTAGVALAPTLETQTRTRTISNAKRRYVSKFPKSRLRREKK